MEEGFNNNENEKLDENNNIESPTKQNKIGNNRRRRELINTESDEDSNFINKNPLQKISKEESKEEENTKENINSKFSGKKFNTINQKDISGLNLKDESSLQ